MQVLTLESLAKQGALAGKRVLIRSDLNAPRDEAGNITDETRLIASVPAIRLALDAGAAVMVMSHLGRPTEGECRPEDSLAGITVRMSELVGVPITLSRRYLEEGVQIKPGQVVMLENCRCNKGEKKNNEELAKAYAALCDVYVNDAFGTAHRAQASTEGVARFASVACAGPLMASEIEALTKAVAQAEHPLVAIVGGSKVSTKLTILNNLAQKVDQLIVGGGIANTFLPSMTCLFIENERRILNFWERTAPAKSCSSFSIFSTPCISKASPLCFTPSTIHPPEVFANALTVSQMFFGRADFASFTSKSSHSISCKRPINSSFVISVSYSGI